MLSMHRPLPSMLIVTPSRFRVPVKSSLVNWLALVGIEDFRSAIARERFPEGLDAKSGVEGVGEAPGQHRAAHRVHDHHQVEKALGHQDVGNTSIGSLVPF